jgi:hypothetical protein
MSIWLLIVLRHHISITLFLLENWPNSLTKDKWQRKHTNSSPRLLWNSKRKETMQNKSKCSLKSIMPWDSDIPILRIVIQMPMFPWNPASLTIKSQKKISIFWLTKSDLTLILFGTSVLLLLQFHWTAKIFRASTKAASNLRYSIMMAILLI